MLTHPKYRPDIDGLRAIAVLSVVVFHAFPTSMRGGFIGVDVFFVISGYLISSILFENLQQGTFRFFQFYERRIKRIFPALLLVLIASLGFGWFALLADEYNQLGKHVAAGAGFISNFVFWKESGYFDTVAETKPLLHLWSLSIEEQFYLVWPLLLWLASKRRIHLLLVTGLMAILSFCLNLKGVWHDATGTFYSPVARFWELLAGSLLALGTLHRKTPTSIQPSIFSTKGFTNLISWIGLTLLSAGFLGIHRELRFPGGWALIPIVGTVFLIWAGPKAWLNRCVLSNRGLVWVGLISYPLYLWHWPLLSFARVIQGATPSKVLRLGAVVISVVLAWVTYRFVETPIRTGKGWSKRKLISLILVMLGVGLWGYITYRKEGFPRRSSLAQISKHEKQVQRLTEDDPVSHARCMKTYNLPGYIRFCNLSGTHKPHIALIGDSHARSLYYGLSQVLERRGEGLLNIGGRLFLGVAVHPSNNDFEIKVYQGGIRATQFAVEEHSIDTVIMASVGLTAVLDHPNGVFQLLDHPEITDRKKIWELAMRQTLDAFVKANKKIVFVIDNPEIDFDPRSCFQNRPLPLMYQPRAICAIRTSDYLARNKEYRQIVFSVLKEYPTVQVFDVSAYLCDETWCWASRGGNILYRDKDHLSFAGAHLLAEELIKVMDGAPSKILLP